MDEFIKILEEHLDTNTGKVTQTGKLKVNLQDLLNTAFNSILTKKSKLYRTMLEKGLLVNFDIKIPKGGFTGETKELLESYKEDVS